ncbi:hypothetical protein O181_003558, partial [Austropuccinia psidii MF-1]|nr:hypothetical protein [Austropuccinia psidii MF-1]
TQPDTISLGIDQNNIVAVPTNIKEMQCYPGFASYYRNHIRKFALIISNASCSQGLGATLHQRQIVDSEPREGVILYISRQLKDSEGRYGATKTECLCLVGDLEKLHCYLEGAVLEFYTDCTAFNSSLHMKTTSRHMLRWQIAIKEYRGNMTIIYKEGKSHTNADGLRRWPLDNFKSNPAYDPEVEAKIPIHFMEVDRRRNFRFSEWLPEIGTLDSRATDSEGTETPILGISSSQLHNDFFSTVMNIFAKYKQCGILLQLLQQKYRSPELESQLEEPWLTDFHSHITIGTNKENKISLDIYHVSAQDALEELLNELREGQFSTTLTTKQKLSLLKMLRKNRPAFAIDEELLGKIRGHDIELYLYVERPYPLMLRRPPYPESLETRKEIEKQINELLDMDVVRKIGHNAIVKVTTPVLMTWHDGKSRLCVDFRALNNYTKADRYPIPRIPHALDKLEKAKYITKMDCINSFYQNGVKPNSMKLLRIISHMGIYGYTRMPFGIKNAPSHFQRMMNTIFQEEILQGRMVVYIDDILIYSEKLEVHAQYTDRVLSKCTPISLKISLKK